MISSFQRNRHFRKESVNKTFTHVQEQKKAMSPRHSVQSKITFTYSQCLCLQCFSSSLFSIHGIIKTEKSNHCNNYGFDELLEKVNDFRIQVAKLQRWHSQKIVRQIMSVCFYHVKYEFRVNLHSNCLNFNELLTRNRCDI